MITTANYIVKAVVDGEVFIFQYDADDAWGALEEFWHGGDYAEHIAILSGSGEFPIDVIAMENSKAIRKYEFTFNCAIFDHFFDKGWSASSTEPGQRYTLNQFAKDIERTNKYLEDRLQRVKAAGNDAELKAVIDSIYSEGFEDGANSTDDNENQEDRPEPKKLVAIMDRWADFCYNHPPYDEVILWMVGGSKKHYLYEHFCAKWHHICENICDNDTMATWIRFYKELDDEWSERLMQYVYNEWKKDV